jgi:hypothetical protein
MKHKHDYEERQWCSLMNIDCPEYWGKGFKESGCPKGYDRDYCKDAGTSQVVNVCDCGKIKPEKRKKQHENKRNQYR